jgi:hypothetical protein
VRLRLLKRLDLPSRSELLVLAGYCLASAVYIAIGVTYVDFLLSVVVGMAYLVFVAWLVPTLVRQFLN